VLTDNTRSAASFLVIKKLAEDFNVLPEERSTRSAFQGLTERARTCWRVEQHRAGTLISTHQYSLIRKLFASKTHRLSPQAHTVCSLNVPGSTLLGLTRRAKIKVWWARTTYVLSKTVDGPTANLF
jgi:hypothetical protein